MAGSLVRLLAVGGLLVYAALALYGPIDADADESLFMIVTLAAYAATGFVVGRWWVLAVAFVPVFLAMPLGTQGDVDHVHLWQWVLFDTFVMLAPAMLAGIVVRKLISREPPRQRRPLSGLG